MFFIEGIVNMNALNKLAARYLEASGFDNIKNYLKDKADQRLASRYMEAADKAGSNFILR